MTLVMRNLCSNLLLLQKALDEIIKDLYVEEEEEHVPASNNYITVSEFAYHYPDLLSPSALRRRIKRYDEVFKDRMDVDENGHVIFCPIAMLENIERSTNNYKLKNKCQRYLHELEECDS